MSLIVIRSYFRFLAHSNTPLTPTLINVLADFHHESYCSPPVMKTERFTDPDLIIKCLKN